MSLIQNLTQVVCSLCYNEIQEVTDMGSFGGFYKGEKKKPKQNKKDKNTNSANIFAKPEYKFPTLVEKKRKSA